MFKIKSATNKMIAKRNLALKKKEFGAKFEFGSNWKLINGHFRICKRMKAQTRMTIKKIEKKRKK